MAINLELPRKLNAVIDKAHQGAAEMLRPISRKYDLREHDYPVELETLAILFEGISEAKSSRSRVPRRSATPKRPRRPTTTAATCRRCST